MVFVNKSDHVKAAYYDNYVTNYIEVLKLQKGKRKY